MKSRIKRRRFRYFIYLFITAVAAVYAYGGLTPWMVKDELLEYINANSDFNIHFRKVYYIPFKGFEFHQLKASRSGDEGHLFESEKFRIQIKILNWQEKRFKFPLIQLVNADIRLDLASQKNKKSDGQPDPDTGPEIPVPLPDRLECEGCNILLPKQNALGYQRIDDMSFRISLNNPDSVPFSASANFGNEIRANELKGVFHIRDGELNLISRGRISRLPASLKPLITDYGVSLNYLRSDYFLEASINTEEMNGGKFPADFRLIFDRLQFAGKKSGFDVSAVLESEVSGSVGPEGGLQVGSIRSEISQAKIAGDALLSDMTFSGGEISYDGEYWNLSGLHFKWMDSAFRSDLNLRKEDGWMLRGGVSQMSRNLAMWKPFFPELFKGPLDLASLKGELKTSIEIDGPAERALQNIRKVSIDIKDSDVSLRKPAAVHLEDVNGRIDVQNQVFDFSEMRFRIGNRRFILKGNINRSEGAESRLSIESEDYHLNAESVWWPDYILVKTAEVKFPGFQTELSGNIFDIETGSIEVQGQADFDFKILKKSMDELDILKDIRFIPGGKAGLEYRLTGVLTENKRMQGSLKLKSEQLQVSDVLLENLEVDMTLSNSVLDVPYLKAGIGPGELRSKGLIDFAIPKAPYFQMHTFADGMDLNGALIMLGVENDSEGIVHTDLNLRGYLNDRTSITGSGYFRVLGGTVWETDRYAELGTIPFLKISGIENVIFRSADGSFTVKEGKVVSEDIVLKSRQINLHLRGVMNIGGALNLDLISRFNPALIRETEQLGNVASTVIRMAEDKITQYKVLGTLTEPILKPNE